MKFIRRKSIMELIFIHLMNVFTTLLASIHLLVFTAAVIDKPLRIYMNSYPIVWIYLLVSTVLLIFISLKITQHMFVYKEMMKKVKENSIYQVRY